MFVKLKRGAIHVVIIGIVFTILASVPTLLENQIKQSSQLKSWYKQFSVKIGQNENFRVSIQGLHVNFFQGIVLKELRVQEKQQLYDFRAENVVISLPILAFFQKRIEPNGIYIEDARLQVSSYAKEVVQSFRGSLEKLSSEIEGSKATKLPIHLLNLYISLYKRQSGNAQTSFVVDLFIKPGKGDVSSQKQGSTKIVLRSRQNLSPTASLVSPSNQSSNNLIDDAQNHRWKVSIETLNFTNKASITFHGAPVDVIALFLKYKNWQQNFAFLQDKKYLKSGIFYGEASFVSEPKQESFTMKGNYDYLELGFRSGVLPSPLSMHKGKGKLQFSFVLGKDDGTKKARRRKKKSVSWLITDFNLNMEQEDFSLDLSKQGHSTQAVQTRSAQKAKKQQMVYTLKGGFFSDPKKKSLYLQNVFGRVDFDLKVYEKDAYYYPQGTVLAKNLKIDAFAQLKNLTKINEKENQKSQKLILSSLEIKKNSPTGEAKISAIGNWLGAKFTVSGIGPYRLFYDIDEFCLNANLDMNIDIDGLVLQDVLSKIYAGYYSIQKSGTKILIRRRLEVEKNEFLNSRLYRCFFAGLNLFAKINLRQIKAFAPFPKHLQFRATANRNQLDLQLEPPPYSQTNANDDDFAASFRYSLYFQGNLPRQKLELKFDLHENKNSFPLFTGSPEPPKEIELRYRYDGYGILPGDMLRRSFSLLEVRSSALVFDNRKILQIITPLDALPKDNNLSLDQLFIRRQTSHIQVKLYFTAKSSELAINGSGSYNIGLGGNVGYSLRVLDNSEKRLNVRILASGKWVPEI